ncbi:MAG: toluene tolerance protein [Zoogloeaceae bacterium]|nr:toluene tolerance protein [Zoogloeaceae bacterium]
MERALKRMSEQEYLALRAGAEVLEADHCGDKVLRLTDGTILKLFRSKRLLSSATVYPYARRFVANARALEKLGIPVPKMLMIARIPSIARDAVHYAPLAGTTLRELARAGLDPSREKALKLAFTRFVIGLHDKGIYFRSLHIGNVVCTPDGQLGLIDFSDLRIHPWSLGKYLRARNMRRMEGIEDERSWLDLKAVVDGRFPETEAGG